MPFHVDRFSLSFKEVVGEDPSSVLCVKLFSPRNSKWVLKIIHFIHLFISFLKIKMLWCIIFGTNTKGYP